MALSGSLRTLSLAEIFQTLSRSQSSGLLRLSSVEGRIDVAFDEGVIVGLIHHDQERQWPAVERLIAFGLIAPEQIDPAGSGGYNSVARLVEQGLLSAEQAHEAITNHVFDELCDLFTWDSANFIFYEDSGSELGDISGCHALSTARSHPLSIDASSLLMEAARRLDEWHRILPDLPEDDAVVDFVPGREVELEVRFGEYPERPVMEMVDGVRTIREIAEETPITQMDVHTVLYDAVCEGVLEVLSPEVMEQRARDLLRLEDPARAVRLLRACLALEPGRRVATVTLAEALRQLGDPPEAAACYATLALSYLQADQGQQAIGAARRAVAIDDNDEYQVILVRCLVESGNNAAAAAQLLGLGQRLIEQHRLDEARGTLRKVLQLDPSSESARHELARIHIVDTAADGDNVVCVECGGQNPRDRDECQVCKASLFLTCLNCQRAVSISDRICVFCGADPHLNKAGGRGMRRAGPSTTAVIRASGRDGSDDRNDAVRVRMAAAREFEESERFAEALVIWQSLAAKQQSNARLNKHIRDLQQLVHDAEVEILISRAHTLRRGRRYVRALRAYRKARQAISPEDPRTVKLSGLIAATKRSSQLTTAIYAIAFLILGLVAWLVVQPIYERRELEQQIAEVHRELESALTQAQGTTGFRRISELLHDDWAGRSESLGSGTAKAYQDLRRRIEVTRERLAGDALVEIERLLAAGDEQAADDALAEFRTVFGGSVRAEERAALEESIELRRQAEADLPAQIAAIRSQLETGAWAAAQAAIVALAPIVADKPERAAELAALRADLQVHRSVYEAAMEEARSLTGSDLERAAQVLDAQLEAAARWDEAAAHAALRNQIREGLAAAAAAYRELQRPLTIERLEGFLATHPASPQAVVARRELRLLREQDERRQRNLEDALDRWRSARQEQALEAAWKAARDLYHSFPDAARAAGVELPLRVATGVPGAELRSAGELLATADAEGVVVWWHPPMDLDQIEVVAEGFDSRSRPWRELEREWSHELPLERALRWTWNGAETIHRTLEDGAGGWLAVAGRTLVALDSGGAVRWQRLVGSQDEMLGGLRLPTWAQLATVDDWILSPQGSGGIQVLERSGDLVAELACPPVVAPPIVYHNELKGADIRLACVSGGVRHGPIDGRLELVPGLDTAISGPALVAIGVDRLLLAATLEGRLVAVDDSQGQVVWQLDLQAADIGRLHSAGPQRVVMVLDGSRIVCVEAGMDGGRVAWEIPLEGGLIGDIQVQEDRILATVGAELLAFDLQRATRRLLLRLPQAPQLPAVAYGGTLCATYHGNGVTTVLCYEGAALRWRRSLTSPATSLAMSEDTVIVGLADGRVVALAP